jgi:hypothetical protein
MLNCYFCKKDYTTKFNLTKHLNKNSCKINDYKLLHDEIDRLHEQITKLTSCNGDKTIGVNVNGSVSGNAKVISNNVNIKIEFNINPINKLDTSYITPEYMKALIEAYDIKPSKVNLLLGGYVKDLICDPEHPENHVTKYLKRKPSTFSSIIEDKDGNKIKVIKGLKDTCELLSDPILDTLKVKLKEFLKKYRKNEEFNYEIYEETIQELRSELNKANVKKALSTVLQNDILNNIEMKLTIDS